MDNGRNPTVKSSRADLFEDFVQVRRAPGFQFNQRLEPRRHLAAAQPSGHIWRPAQRKHSLHGARRTVAGAAANLTVNHRDAHLALAASITYLAQWRVQVLQHLQIKVSKATDRWRHHWPPSF